MVVMNIEFFKFDLFLGFGNINRNRSPLDVKSNLKIMAVIVPRDGVLNICTLKIIKHMLMNVFASFIRMFCRLFQGLVSCVLGADSEVRLL